MNYSIRVYRNGYINAWKCVEWKREAISALDRYIYRRSMTFFNDVAAVGAK